jgi:hypothetical protein
MKLATAKDLCVLEDMPKAISPVFHERKDLTPELKAVVKDTIYVDYPCFVIDWASMRLRHSCFLHSPGISVAQVGGSTFETLKKAVEFVEKNKHQIVVHKLIIPNWINRVILSYAAKPETLPSHEI